MFVQVANVKASTKKLMALHCEILGIYGCTNEVKLSYVRTLFLLSYNLQM